MQWLNAACIEEGVVFRRVSRTGTVWGPKISEKLVWWVVREKAKAAGIKKLAADSIPKLSGSTLSLATITASISRNSGDALTDD
jgi:hypothetical protein